MHGLMDKLARLFAWLGGAVLTILIIQITLSVAGRTINSMLHSDFMQSFLPGIASVLLATGVGPINGDFELVEAGMAFVIFAFMPLCHLNGAHASVDIFTSRFPLGLRNTLRSVIEIVFAAVVVLIAWQLFQGMLSKLKTGQTTFLLQFPIWWAYAFSLTAAVASAVVAVYTASARSVEMVTGTKIMPDDLGADH